MSGKRELIRIGGASAAWGDSPGATTQLLLGADIDYLVYDYLAEMTMSIMARARHDNPARGYATDFVTRAMKPNLREIADRKVKVVSNAGGLNPISCVQALRKLVADAGLSLRIAAVVGDDLLPKAPALAMRGIREAYSDEPFPDLEQVRSINAYLGAFPIAAALDAGADIVVTGRCVDSATTLGACIHAFGWGPDDLHLLAAGTLAGHILECGVQATGGNFTDWSEVVEGCDTLGYPVAEIASGGDFVVTKPRDTAGQVSVGTICEQLVYEIGDPAAYLVPDVCADFSDVRVESVGPDRVRVSGARGYAAPDHYKVSLTFADGYRGGRIQTAYGSNAAEKVRRYADAALRRTAETLRARNLAPLSETNLQMVGATPGSREVAFNLSVRHPSEDGVKVFLKEGTTEIGLAVPGGVTGFGGGSRSKPEPVVRLFSFFVPKPEARIAVEIDGAEVPFEEPDRAAAVPRRPSPPATPEIPDLEEAAVIVPLETLAWARSGDKGNKANIGIIARERDYLPFIARAITSKAVAAHFAGEVDGPVERFDMPGVGALNFLLHGALGGGGMASLRIDVLGKALAQRLLDMPVAITKTIAERDRLRPRGEGTSHDV